MKAEEFVGLLRNAMPSKEKLASYGLDEDEIAEIQSTFQAVRRVGVIAIPDITGEVGRLVALFDCSSVEVGLIHFNSQLVSEKIGMRFGLCEADALLVKPDRTVVMCDHAVPEREVFRCATDPERFLDALGAFVRIRVEKERWSGRAEAAANNCSAASGSHTSASFNQMLCGFLA